MRLAFLLILFDLACGGRTEVLGTGVPIDGAIPSDANDFVTCGDASCPASTEFCRGSTGDGGFTEMCAPLPAHCHSCDCAETPSLDQVCVCSSTGDAIDVSCKSL